MFLSHCIVIVNLITSCVCVSGFLRDLCELLLYLLLPPGDFHNKNMRYFLRVSTLKKQYIHIKSHAYLKNKRSQQVLIHWFE